MSTSQISRLVTVSHVLYEREVLELRRENLLMHKENQELKLKLFWKEHDIYALNLAICASPKRQPPHADLYIIWNQWMEPMLKTCGLEVEAVSTRASRQSDLDTHLVCSSPYLFHAYGAKLWKAKSVEDPELLKLKALFDALAAPN